MPELSCRFGPKPINCADRGAKGAMVTPHRIGQAVGELELSLTLYMPPRHNHRVFLEHPTPAKLQPESRNRILTFSIEAGSGSKSRYTRVRCKAKGAHKGNRNHGYG
jgi:hypothetical protein